MCGNRGGVEIFDLWVGVRSALCGPHRTPECGWLWSLMRTLLKFELSMYFLGNFLEWNVQNTKFELDEYYYMQKQNPLIFPLCKYIVILSSMYHQCKYHPALFERNLNLASFKTSFIHWTDEIRKEGECWLLLLLWTNKSILSPPAEQPLHMASKWAEKL